MIFTSSKPYLVFIFASIAICTFAQDVSTQEPASRATIMLLKLSLPADLQMARVALIQGDVELLLRILPNGSVASAQIVSGHPMLRQAALESAQQSQFQCSGCSNEPVTLAMTYAFRLAEEGQVNADPCCCSHPNSLRPHGSPEVSASLNHVTVTIPADPVCRCPDECEERLAQEQSRFRSIKCFYLWKCGKREIFLQ